ncbi:hypothetical protein LXA25_18060, partial [Erwinia amylovora]
GVNKGSELVIAPLGTNPSMKSSYEYDGWNRILSMRLISEEVNFKAIFKAYQVLLVPGGPEKRMPLAPLLYNF